MRCPPCRRFPVPSIGHLPPVRNTPVPGSVVTYLSPDLGDNEMVTRGVVTNDPVQDPFTGQVWLPVEVATGVHAAIPMANLLAVDPPG